MEKKDLRIVFMGTPEFAVGTLSKLVEGGYNVVAVVTQPDKPVGRHQDTLQPSEVCFGTWSACASACKDEGASFCRRVGIV